MASEYEIFSAVFHNNLQLVNKLLEEDKNLIDSTNDRENTLLHHAITFLSTFLDLYKHRPKLYGDPQEIIKLLLQKGIDINKKNKSGLTAFELADNSYKRLLLFSAIEVAHFETVKQLVDSDKSLLNSIDEEGNTPLHHAMTTKYQYYKGNESSLQDIIEFLQIREADIKIKNNAGFTPFELALQNSINSDTGYFTAENNINNNQVQPDNE